MYAHYPVKLRESNLSQHYIVYFTYC